MLRTKAAVRLSDMVMHVGHTLTVAKYGDYNYTIECDDCSEVLADVDAPPGHEEGTS